MGRTRSRLPDLRGRAVIHQGTGPGLSPYVIGEQVGQETITLAAAQMTSHSHSFGGTAAAGNTQRRVRPVVLREYAFRLPDLRRHREPGRPCRPRQ